MDNNGVGGGNGREMGRAGVGEKAENCTSTIIKKEKKRTELIFYG